ALFMRNDYDDAKVPMLTVTHGRRSTRNHILGYTVALAAVAICIGFTSIGGPVYLGVALLLNAAFFKGAFDIWRRDEAMSEKDDFKAERRFFKFSLMYLFVHFSAILADSVLRQFGIGLWG
ncbi:MAG: protoheme IX farnesyltransferase, partial [Paracoccaceae bacterium]|nr:protoheme IX farnesyltransferase [Paracoccaceae bacterium]